MESISHGNTSVRLWTRSGRVTDSNKRTSVVSSGSGENLNVSSITKHDIWIREEDGTEVPIQVAGADIPLRIGQRISVVAAALDGEEDGHAVALVNHSSGQWSRTLSEENVRSLFRVTTHWAVGWVVLAVSFLVLGIGSSAPETSSVHLLSVASPLCGIAYLVYNLRLYFKSGERLYYCFGEVAKKLAQEKYSAVAEGIANPMKGGLASSDMTVLSRKALSGAMVLAATFALLSAIFEIKSISELQTEAALNVLAYYMVFFPMTWAVLSMLGGIRRFLPSQFRSARFNQNQATPRPVTFARTAIGLPIGIALVIGYAPSIWSVLPYAVTYEMYSSGFFMSEVILANAPQFVLAWVVVSALFYGYRRWREY